MLMTLKPGLQHWVLEFYKACSNDAPGLTLTYFMARSNLVPYAFVWEKVKTMNFSDTIVVYDIKVGRCSQLNGYMKLYEYQRSRSLTDLGPSHSDSIFLNFFSSITTDFNISSALRWAIQDQWSSGWSDPLSTSMLQVCKQRRLWQDCADACVISTIISWAGSNGITLW